jgi:hypothetical protein
MKLKKIAAVAITILIITFLSGCSTVRGIGSIFASPTPTATQTATPTLTPSPTLTPTSSLAERPIDRDKLYRFPESYEYLISHLDQFVQAPDVLAETEAFRNWWYDVFIPLMGYWGDLEPNININALNIDENRFTYARLPANVNNVIGEIPIFYFIHDGVVYPALVFTINFEGIGNIGTWVYILHAPGEITVPLEGLDVIQHIYEGHPIIQLSGEIGMSVMTADNEVNRAFFNSGFNWLGCSQGNNWAADANRFAIGLANIVTTAMQEN